MQEGAMQTVIRVLWMVINRATLNKSASVDFAVGYETALRSVAELMGLNWNDITIHPQDQELIKSLLSKE